MLGILVSGVLRVTRPWRLPGSKRLYNAAGWPLLGAGVAISASAVWSASGVDLEQPSALVSTGPYGKSRNPMYIGWAWFYLGVALVTRNAWMLATLPVVAGLTHREILREEHELERALGKEYTRYRKQVPRYL
jgi:protein-S-isoprenylcysteine O-methyltransferase Ste14